MEEKIKKIVQMALEEVNEDADEVIEYGENTALFGKGEGTDSGAVWERSVSCIRSGLRKEI